MKTKMNPLRLTAIAALLLAPQTVLAANECGPGPVVTCTGNQPAGVSYATATDLTVTTSGNINAGANGFDLTGTGTAGISFTTGGAVTGAGGADLLTGSGDITVRLVGGNIDGGLRAISTTGDIDIRKAPPIDQSFSSNGALTAITGGNITIFRSGQGALTTDSSSGSGLTHIVNSNTNRTGASGAINATVGSGGLVLDLTGIAEPNTHPGTGVQFGGASVNGLSVQGSGAAQVNLWRDAFLLGTASQARVLRLDANYARLDGAVDFSNLTGGAEINVLRGGAWRLDATAQLSAAADAVRIGEGGFVYLSIGSTNALEVPRSIDFGGGDDTLINEGHLVIGLETFGPEPVNGPQPGYYPSDVPRDRYEAELRLVNLETFRNRGNIWLGTAMQTSSIVHPDDALFLQGSDRAIDDILTMPGTTFIGEAGSRIWMDVNLAVTSAVQDRCDVGLRDAVTGSFPAADCVNLQNGTSQGVTTLVISDISSGGRGAYNPEGVVLVDLSDGNGAPGSGGGGETGNFVIDPATRYYSPAFGGVIDNGMFMYSIRYDEEQAQFKLNAVPSAGAHHQPLIANGAQAAWRTATGSFFDRQADLRDTLRGGSNDQGIWLRTGYDAGERDVQQIVAVPSGDIVYDNTHDLNTSTVTLGMDFLNGSGGDRTWLFGAMLGYVRTDMEYADSWTDTAAMNGTLVGLYGSWVDGPLFVDATISQIWTRLDQDMPQAELFRDSLLSTDIETLGAQVEAGWRFDLGAARLEPLLTLSHVTTKVDDFKVPEGDPTLPGNQVMFEDTTSTRVGAGLRGSTELAVFGDVKLGLSLTGRYQQELDGEAKARIGNLNPISPEVVDKFDGSFSELMGGVTLANATGRISGVLNVGSKFGDDYSALSGSFGFRYQW